MRGPVKLRFGLEWRLGRRSLVPEPAAETDARELEVNVIFTTMESTWAALKTAGELACDLGAQIRILVCQVVPYPLPITSPPALPAFTERRFRVLASEARVKTSVQVLLCRDRREGLLDFLKPESLLVIGGKKHWWLGREQRLARMLESRGHHVVFTDATGERRKEQVFEKVWELPMPNSSH